MSLSEGEEADGTGENDAVPKHGAEDFALFANQADGSDTHGDILRRDHFAGDTAGGIRRSEQHGVEMKLMSSGDLKIAEKKIACRVAAA